MNKKALSPITALIIMIVVIVVVSPTQSKYCNVIIPVPPYQNATYAHAWINLGSYQIDGAKPIQQLPYNLTITETTQDQITLRVIYYSQIALHQSNNTTIYEFIAISNEIDYSINLKP
jgi:flagellin-like protein